MKGSGLREQLWTNPLPDAPGDGACFKDLQAYSSSEQQNRHAMAAM